MKWFKNLKSNYSQKKDAELAISEMKYSSNIHFSDSVNGMTINFVKATGGYVLELRHHENHDGNLNLAIGPSSARRNTELYIIKDGEDLGEEIGKIITISMLKK